MSKKNDTIVEQVKQPQKTTKKDIEFYKTGITLLDLCLGGGLGKGYISNIIGWEATGKTMVVCEALGYNHNTNKNFMHKFDNAESGFTLDTKELFNFNINLIEPRSEKVEQFMFNFENTLKRIKEDKEMIYVLDSLDGLSDEREEKKHRKDMTKVKKSMKKDDSSSDDSSDNTIKGDYSGKAKGMSQFLRQNNAPINKTKVHLCITSQLRDKMNVTFGNPAERSGGKALNFYSSQIVWLKLMSKLTKKIEVQGNNYERKVGTLVKAEVKKNKLGKSFRECYFFIDFNFGIDNVKSNLCFLYNLISNKGEFKERKEYTWDGNKFADLDTFILFIESNNLEKELENRVINLWNEIESNLIVERKRKY